MYPNEFIEWCIQNVTIINVEQCAVTYTCEGITEFAGETCLIPDKKINSRCDDQFVYCYNVDGEDEEYNSISELHDKWRKLEKT